jgi:cupin 2 domain-containing protein
VNLIDALAEADLERFLDKVAQLNALVASLEEQPDRRQRFAACTEHNQVVQLARVWGFEIGRRWGETAETPRLRSDNLLAHPVPSAGSEAVLDLQRGEGWRLQLIHSCDHSSPAGFWYDQDEHEWLLLLRGSARLRLRDPEEERDLSVGDVLVLPPHRRHRVERTDPEPGTLWLTLFWRDPSPEGADLRPA